MKLTNWVTLVSMGVGAAAMAATTTTSLESQNRIQIGVEAGMLVNQISGPKDLNISNRSGLAAGLVLDFPLSETFAVRTEGIYQRRSSQLARAGTAELTASADSIYVPVMLRWSPIKATVSPFVLAGPTVTFNVNNSIEGGTREAAAAAGYDPNTFEFGAAVGGGLDIGPAFAVARYTWGITELSRNDADFKNRGFQLMAGLRF